MIKETFFSDDIDIKIVITKTCEELNKDISTRKCIKYFRLFVVSGIFRYVSEYLKKHNIDSFGLQLENNLDNDTNYLA